MLIVRLKTVTKWWRKPNAMEQHDKFHTVTYIAVSSGDDGMYASHQV